MKRAEDLIRRVAEEDHTFRQHAAEAEAFLRQCAERSPNDALPMALAAEYTGRWRHRMNGFSRFAFETWIDPVHRTCHTKDIRLQAGYQKLSRWADGGEEHAVSCVTYATFCNPRDGSLRSVELLMATIGQHAIGRAVQHSDASDERIKFMLHPLTEIKDPFAIARPDTTFRIEDPTRAGYWYGLLLRSPKGGISLGVRTYRPKR